MSSDFSGHEGKGYADEDNVSPSDSGSPSTSLAAVTGQGAKASPFGNSSDLLVDSDAPEEVAIYVDSTGAWDGRPRDWPPIPGYDCVPHEVRQIPSSFYNRDSFRNLITRTCLVKNSDDARRFKLAICQRTERLPPKSSCRVLIGFLGNKNLPANVFDYLSKIDPSRNNTFARLFAQRGGNVRKPSGSASPAPSVVAPPATSHNIQRTLTPPATVEVPPQQSSPAPPPEAKHKKKGKRKAARETSTESNRSKRHLPDGPPLTGLLSPNVWVAKRLQFNLLSEEKTLVSGLTREEASNMALELAARSAMCLSYAVEDTTSTAAELQALREKFEASFKANQDLTLRLAEAEGMAEEDKKKASTLLAEARAAQRRMQRSLDDAQLDLHKSTASISTLTAERDSLRASISTLTAERDALRARVAEVEAENKLLGDEVVNEHVLGFDKALAQCNLLFQVPTDDSRLNVSMMVVNGQLVPSSLSV
ncbi:hypothetical protein LR48_Vigan102s004100 [Vigna angularis]|uniref:Uncharacterized protein n=1 Tax=Phaseolus angularis TaxID=3914 RepID=A0A0L9T471_PHAAN|nr:hypothetical protein LR48_Vigan102s004100 [Vigna angularis]